MTPGTSNEKAVAEIVGSLILISIFVLAFAILAMVLLSQPAPQKIPAIAISITNQSKIIRISHESGDSISMKEFKVLVDEVPETFSCNDCGDSWSIGETLTIDYSDHPNFPNKVDIVFSGSGTAQRLLSSIYFGTMTPTQTPVTIPTSPTPVTTATTLPVGAPVANFTGTPTSGPVPLTVVFTDMSTGTPTGWRWTFGDTGTGNTSTLRNPTHTYTVPGNYSVNLTVSNAGGSNTLVRTGYITVTSTYAQRVVAGRSTGYTDSTGKVWSADRSYSAGSWGNTGGSTYSNSNTIAGTPDPDLYRSERYGNFQYQFTVPDGNYQVTLKFAEIYWDSVGQRVFNVDIEGTRVMSNVDLNALVGKNTIYDRTFAVSVSHGILNINFQTIQDNAKISAIEVVSGTPIPAPPFAAFTGTPSEGFAPLMVSFTDTSTGTPTSWNWVFGDNGAGNTSAAQNPVHSFTIPGTYSVNLTVSNAGGSNSLVQSNYISVSNAPPAVLSITPDSGYNDTSVSITNLAGTGFINGATVRLNITGRPDIPATSVTVVSSTQITCSFALNGVPDGTRNVVVTNPDGKSGMLAGGFTVIQALPAPTVTSRSNATLYRGWMGYELIGGTNFVSGAQSVMNTTTGYSVPSTFCDVRSSTQMYCSYDLFDETESTAYRVAVINPDGKSGLMATNLVSVSSPAPTITSSTPSTGMQASTVFITRLLGTYFQPDAIVVYSLGATTIPLQNINVVSSTNITGTLVIPSDAIVGSYSVVVTNSDLKSVTRASTFTVTSNAPTVTSRSNATLYRGWPGYELIGGTNFVSGAQSVLNTTTGYSVPSTFCDVRSSTQMYCSYDLFDETESTAYRVAVINPDGKSGIRTTNLVSMSSPAPTIPSTPPFSPSTGARGTNSIVVTAPGTYLQPGMGVVLTSASNPVTTINALSVNVISPTQVIITFNIPAGATTGSYTARYTNTDGKTVARTARFTVT
jgi:PKD repeat protein